MHKTPLQATPTSKLGSKEQFDVITTIWREINESIRDAVRFRWSVTVAFLTAMGAISYAAAAQKAVSPWICVLSAVGCAAAFAAQFWWQSSYENLVVTWIEASDELAEQLRALGAHSGLTLNVSGLATKRDAAHGYRGLMIVSGLFAVAAIAWLLNMARAS